MPLFVRAQLVRHRTASQNHQSFRYDNPSGDYYVPPIGRMATNDNWNKQGSGDALPIHLAKAYRDQLEEGAELQWKRYCRMATGEDLEDKSVPPLTKELARLTLGPNFYATACWKIDVKNLMHFLKLRDDGHAQQEIREMAQIISHFFKREFPMTYEAYVEHYVRSKKFSGSEMDILVASIDEEKLAHNLESSSLRKSRKRELLLKLKREE